MRGFNVFGCSFSCGNGFFGGYSARSQSKEWWVIRLSGFVANFGFSAAGGIAVQKETACAR
jgi:hypothetical protein